MRKKHHKKYHILFSSWYIFYIVILIAAIIFLPTKVISYQVDVPYEDLEEYTETVPYETTEEYVENIPVEEQEAYQEEECSNRPTQYNRVMSSGWTGFFNQNLKIDCQISNLENQVLTYVYIIIAGNTVPLTVDNALFKYGPYSTTIGAYTTQTVTTTFNGASGSVTGYNCLVQPPNVEECQLVTKYRTVTEYKPVIKTRTVTKYRDETKYRKVEEMSTETRYKEVNWLFGFDAIVKFRNLEKYQE